MAKNNLLNVNFELNVPTLPVSQRKDTPKIETDPF